MVEITKQPSIWTLKLTKQTPENKLERMPPTQKTYHPKGTTIF